MGETPASAVARIAPRTPGEIFRGPRVVAGCDSITAGDWGLGAPTRFPANSWFTHFALLSGGRIRPVANIGVPRNTIAQMLARFDTDVTPYRPHIFMALVGTNDVATSLSSFSASLGSLLTKCRAIKAELVLCTIPPREANGTTSDQRDVVDRQNVVIAGFAERHGLVLIDFYTLLIDPTSRGWLTGGTASYDGIHPEPATAYTMGAYAWSVMSSRLPARGPALTTSAYDATNLVKNGLFLASGSNLGTNWTISGTVTATKETDSDILGNWGRLSGATLAYASQNISGVFSAGDVIALSGRVEILDVTTLMNVATRLKFLDVGNTVLHTIAPLESLSHTLADGVFYAETQVPTGTTYLTLELLIANTSGGTVTAQWAQVTVRNLTVLGVV